jgi:hypothetical protein
MTVEARRIVANQPLPERATPAERVATLDADIREAAAKARQKCNEYFLRKFSVNGWEIDDSEWGMGVADRTVTVIMRIKRGQE